MARRPVPARRSTPRRAPLPGCPVPTPANPLAPGTPSVREQVGECLRAASFVDAAAGIPRREPGQCGRPRKYPEYVWTLWTELRAIFGSHHAVERELGRGRWWTYIRRRLAELHPSLPKLPAEPPTRQSFEYMRDTYLATDAALASSGESHTSVAVAQAIEAGCLDPNGPGSFTHPDLLRTLYGDGKVVTPLYKNQREGKVPRSKRKVRFDPDAGWHQEGGNAKKTWGLKFVLLSTRRPEGRFILGVEHEGQGGEAAAALSMLRGVRPLAPGAQAVVWDSILRGTHNQTILTELGLVPVVKVHAKQNPDGSEGRRRKTYVPKSVDLETKTVQRPDGSAVLVHLSAVDGAVCVKYVTETGEPHYEPLEVVRIQRHTNKSGTYRWYGHYKLPAEFGGAEVTIRLHQTDDDERRGLNRTENLRAIPESSPDFQRLHVLRPDAESINRGIEDSLFINRASAKGWRRQMVDLLGYARLVNALTLARCRGRQPVVEAA